MRKDEKILILTLGTGSVIEKKVEESFKGDIDEKLKTIYEKEEYFYRKATYLIKGLEGKQESEFVAAPLVEVEQPDKIVLIGTVRSSWTGFYTKFAKEKNFEEFKTLYHIEKEKGHGKDTKGKELDSMQETVQSIYQEKLCFPGVSKQIEIKVIFVRYGIDEEQLLENYRRISTIENILEQGKNYEISFDITHSFRSLPLYNLIILNYLKYVLQYNIQIRHIYYGNFEIAGENDDISPVVDLGNLAEVLNLTNGVCEFQNTGNVATLLELIPEEESVLRETLKKFDLAVQLNAYDEIVESLKALLKTSICEENTKGRYADLKTMLSQALSTELLGDYSIDWLDDAVENWKKMGEMQYLLCRWLLNQNRYGQAVATALESLRSYLVILYLQAKHMEVDVEACKDENNRKAAVQKIKQATRRMSDEDRQEKIQGLLWELEQARNKAAKVRNRFAHNLISPYEVMEENRQEIEIFIHYLGELREVLKKEPWKIQKFFEIRKRKVEKKKVEKKKERIRLFISDQYKPADYYRKYASTNRFQYKVYCLPEEIAEKLKKDRRKNDSAPLRNGTFLKKYIERYFDVETVEVIIEKKFNYRQKVHYVEILRKGGIKNLKEENEGGEKELLPIPKCEFEIFWDTEKYAEDFGQEILELEPVQLKFE